MPISKRANKRRPLITVIWPGEENCDDKPLVGVFYSPHDGTAQFEFVGTTVASDESGFADFLWDFAKALREYQVNCVLEQLEAAEGRAAASETTPPGRVES